MLGRRHTIAWLQSDFYRKQYHRILRWLMVAIVIIYFLIATLIYLILFAPATPSYYANTTDGRIMTMPGGT